MDIFYHKGTRYAALIDESFSGFMKIEPSCLEVSGVKYKKITVWIKQGTVDRTSIEIGGYRHADKVSLDEHNYIPEFETAANLIKESINIGLGLAKSRGVGA